MTVAYSSSSSMVFALTFFEIGCTEKTKQTQKDFVLIGGRLLSCLASAEMFPQLSQKYYLSNPINSKRVT